VFCTITKLNLPETLKQSNANVRCASTSKLMWKYISVAEPQYMPRLEQISRLEITRIWSSSFGSIRVRSDRIITEKGLSREERQFYNTIVVGKKKIEE
jgi:hypothetical protein